MSERSVDAVMEAVLHPDPGDAERLAHRCLLEAKQQRRARYAAGFCLLGCALGAGVAYASGARIAQGIVWGGLVGVLLGHMVAGWRARRTERSPAGIARRRR